MTMFKSLGLNKRIPNFVLSLRGHTKTRRELTPFCAKESFALARPFFVFHDSSIISEFLLIIAKTAMFSDLKEGENQCADSILLSKPNTNEPRPCSSSASTSTMVSSSSSSSRPIQWTKSLEKMPPFTRVQIEKHRELSGKRKISTNKKGVPVMKTLRRGSQFKEERYLSADTNLLALQRRDF